MLLSDLDCQQGLSTLAMIGDDNEGLEFDLPPFLTKVGWIAQLQGSLWTNLWRCAVLPLDNEKSCFCKIMKITQVYF
jgi:hypothetical protein